MNEKIIYFDNAATTFPKPPAVLDAAYDCAKNWCGNAGRGSHPYALRTAEAIYSARESLASLFGAHPENVAFTLNTTYALNLAIKGALHRGGHILISDLEHNSVLRPIVRLARERKISYDIFPTHGEGAPLPTSQIISGIISRLRPETQAICAIHTSNICSYTLPVREIGALCKRHSLTFIVDAAQGAGHSDIDMRRDGIDVLCIPGHKGLYSPQGVGALLLGDGIRLDTVIEGGNGVSSLDPSMGSLSPERYEAGTLCAPAIVGLWQGVEFVRSLGLSTISAHESALCRRARRRLLAVDGARVYGESDGSILLFNLDTVHPDTLGELLSSHGFCLRSGYHCAPLAHKTLATPEGGAVRLSFSVFNTEGEVDALCDTIKNIAMGL